jgi:hypothetical protein
MRTLRYRTVVFSSAFELRQIYVEGWGLFTPNVRLFVNTSINATQRKFADNQIQMAFTESSMKQITLPLTISHINKHATCLKELACSLQLIVLHVQYIDKGILS